MLKINLKKIFKIYLEQLNVDALLTIDALEELQKVRDGNGYLIEDLLNLCMYVCSFKIF